MCGKDRTMDKVDILGVKVDRVNVDEAAERIMAMLEERRAHSVYTPNSEILMLAYENAEFREILNKADLLTADGIGVVYASRILHDPIAERAAGFDIATEVVKRIAQSGHRLFLFGGREGVAEQAKAKLEEQYEFINIVGTQHGYFSPEEEPAIVDRINRSGAEIVFVCLGAPAQEKWIHRNLPNLRAKVLMGIGGSLDVFAGNVERAPEIWCRLGLEWLYRLAKEPWRIKRMAALPKFALTVLLKGKRYDEDDDEE